MVNLDNNVSQKDKDDIRKEDELNNLLDKNLMHFSNLTPGRYEHFLSVVGSRDGRSTGTGEKVDVPGVGFVKTRKKGDLFGSDQFFATSGERMSRDEFFDEIEFILEKNKENNNKNKSIFNQSEIKRFSELGISIEKINEMLSAGGEKDLRSILSGEVMPGMMSDNNIIKDGSKSLSTLNPFKVFDESILSAQKDNKKLLNNYNEMLLASTTLSSGVFTDQATAPTTGIQGEMYNYMTKELGLSHNKALGILANIHRESSFDIDAKGDPHAGGSFGLFQWNADANMH